MGPYGPLATQLLSLFTDSEGYLIGGGRVFRRGGRDTWVNHWNRRWGNRYSAILHGISLLCSRGVSRGVQHRSA